MLARFVKRERDFRPERRYCLSSTHPPESSHAAPARSRHLEPPNPSSQPAGTAHRSSDRSYPPRGGEA